MVRKTKSSTRNIEFNYYESYIGSEKYINSIADYKANKNQKHVILLESTDYIIKTGAEINNDASKNTNCDKYVKKVVNIDTGLTDDLTNYHIYGAPEKWILDNRQQYNNCGVECILNVLAMAGIKKITNQNSIEKSFTKELWNRGLVQDDGKLGGFDVADGGTRITDYRDILKEYGINAKAYASEYFATTTADGYITSLESVANIVKNGGAAILAVSSYLLWQEYKKGTSADSIEYNINPNQCVLDHAITVTGVVYNENNELTGFYIHDTGVWMTRYISLVEMQSVTLDEQTNSTWKTKEGVFGAIIEDNIKSWADNINATGNYLSNVIVGNSGNNIIKGLGGDDILIGNSGDDRIYGGSGTDYIYGNDEIKAGNIDVKGNNILYGEGGSDYIYGGSYNDIIYGGNDIDYLYGNDGIDVIYGGNGNDYIYGGDGDDRLLGQSGKDIIYGGNGDDTIAGGAGNDTIYGEAGYDKIDCGSGDDIVIFEENCQEDSLTSSSGSVSLYFKDILAQNLNYGFEGSTFIAGYNNNNLVKYTNFFNSKNNKYQTAYLIDSSDNKYRISATNAKGNVKVADKTGNNIFFSDSYKNNTISTSINNDIVFMYEGDDTITYTGGHDYYYSTHGNDTYNIEYFNPFTNVHICDDFSLEDDKYSTNDKLDINTNLNNIRLLYDITNEGKPSNDLYLLYKDDESYSKSELKNIITDNSNARGFIKISDYFQIEKVVSEKSNTDETEYTNTGKIETISVKGNIIANIDSVIDSLNEEVSKWLIKNGQTNTFDVIKDPNTDITELLQIYNNAELKINSNDVYK